jgi:hypothetical protein
MSNGKARALGRSVCIAVATAMLWAPPAGAQNAPPTTAPASGVVPNPGPNPTIPGSSLITELLGWLKYAALASAVAGLLLGGVAMGIGYSGSNYGASAAGRRWLLGGLGAAVIAGLAHTIAVTLYEAT